MDTFDNKTAFVTGAASGIGFALTEALTAQGTHVMMADINGDLLVEAAGRLSGRAGKVDTVVCDVTQHDQVIAAADATEAAFGDVHIVINNAGVALAGKPGTIPIADWRWIVDINLMGIVHGVETFVPRMRRHGQGGHIVNTASMAGHVTMPGMAPYHATKFAAVGYSESLAQELKSQNIGVSVLCPTWVKSNIYNTGKARPSAGHAPDPKAAPDAMADQMYNMTKNLVDNGMEADILADLVLKSITANRLYIFNDPEARIAITQRQNTLLADYDACLTDLGMDIPKG